MYFVSADFSCSSRMPAVLASMVPGGPLTTCVQPEESVTCWSLRWGRFLRRVILVSIFGRRRLALRDLEVSGVVGLRRQVGCQKKAKVVWPIAFAFRFSVRF